MVQNSRFQTKVLFFHGADNRHGGLGRTIALAMSKKTKNVTQRKCLGITVKFIQCKSALIASECS